MCWLWRLIQVLDRSSEAIWDFIAAPFRLSILEYEVQATRLQQCEQEVIKAAIEFHEGQPGARARLNLAVVVLKIERPNRFGRNW